jgi:DNA-binding NarL/FixJ family response regulator
MKVSPEISRPRVLIADDHPELILCVRGLLEQDFDVVGTVGDGSSLVEEAIRLQPELIVTDLSMPVLNGIQAINKLRQAGSTSKVVFLSMYRHSEIVQACFDAGASGFVIKSDMQTDLIAALNQALAGRTYISPCVA